jgi:hypothetical protein
VAVAASIPGWVATAMMANVDKRQEGGGSGALDEGRGWGRE